MALHAIRRGVAELSRCVAFLTGNGGVQPEQREFRELVIEPHIGLPRTLSVAPLAVLAFLTGMDVILAMARDARGVEFFFVRVHRVATLAARECMPPLQRERRVAIVIEANLAPGVRSVASATILAIATAMNVIGSVTGGAVARSGIGVEVALVAEDTARLGVPPVERKLRVSAMVEARRIPGRDGVATLAGRPESPSMNVVETVARATIRGCRFVAFVGVTQRASDVFVSTLERKVGLLMVEASFAPACLGVAITARLTERSLVRIVVPVAGGAILRRIAVLLPDCVALSTIEHTMGTDQWGVGPIVIEEKRGQADDVGVPPLVIGVTASTRHLDDPGSQKVETRPRLPVLLDPLVALDTEDVLGFAIEGPMARCAVVLDILMGTDHRAGIEHHLELGASRRSTQEHAHPRNNEDTGTH